MKRVSARPLPLLIAPLLFAPLIAFTACGGGSAPAPAPAVTLTVSPQPASVAVNSTTTFTATTNAPSQTINWGFVDQGNNVNLGTPADQAGGTTFTYTAPPTPPTTGASPSPPGTVTLRVGAGEGAIYVQFAMTVTAPSITTSISAPAQTVALSKTLSISAYAIGNTNNAITMQVNGTTGGSATYGTIAPLTNGFYGEYTYTAPATMPMTGNTVTVTVISQADPTKSSSMTVTLTSS